MTIIIVLASIANLLQNQFGEQRIIVNNVCVLSPCKRERRVICPAVKFCKCNSEIDFCFAKQINIVEEYAVEYAVGGGLLIQMMNVLVV